MGLCQSKNQEEQAQFDRRRSIVQYKLAQDRLAKWCANPVSEQKATKMNRFPGKYIAYMHSQKNYRNNGYKPNQDNFLINADENIFGIFDGHGPVGEQTSFFCHDECVRSWHHCEDAAAAAGSEADDPMSVPSVYDDETANTLYHTCVLMNKWLRASPINDTYSGTTAVVCKAVDSALYIASVGDSRAIAIKRGPNDTLVSESLTAEHDLYRQDEQERLSKFDVEFTTMSQAEGKVPKGQEYWDGSEPPRVFFRGSAAPGTAFTRSIGDAFAETAGVICTPDVVKHEIQPESDYMYLVMSDGVFEFLEDDQIVTIMARFPNPLEGCAAVCHESLSTWLFFEHGQTDDITMVAVHNMECPPLKTFNPKNMPVMDAVKLSLKQSYLFQGVNPKLLDVGMKALVQKKFKKGDLVCQEEHIDDSFYIVLSGEFAGSYHESRAAPNKFVRTYSHFPGWHSYFNEQAAAYGERVSYTVHAKTDGVLLVLAGPKFREIVTTGALRPHLVKGADAEEGAVLITQRRFSRPGITIGDIGAEIDDEASGHTGAGSAKTAATTNLVPKPKVKGKRTGRGSLAVWDS